MTEKLDDLSLRIKQLRDKLGEGQAAFARRLGVSQSTVSRWEKGLQPPTAQAVEIMTDLAKAFELALEQQTPHVRATGEVRPGGEVFLISAEFSGPKIHVPLDKPAVAFIARANVLPMCNDGDALIFLHPDPAPIEECLGHICLVTLPDGKLFVKRLGKGTKPDRYSLTLPGGASIEDAQIVSASRLAWISCKINFH